MFLVCFSLIFALISWGCGRGSYWCHALKELHLTSFCLFYGPFLKNLLLCVCLLVERWLVGHCGRLQVRAVDFSVLLCAPWWGGGVSFATPWGRRRLGQTKWRSDCTLWEIFLKNETSCSGVCLKQKNTFYFKKDKIFVFKQIEISLTSEMDQQHPLASPSA